MLKYGLPLCPALIFSWVIDFSDRYFLRYFLTLDKVGLYSLGYRFGQIVYMAVLTFLMCWGPILFTIVKEKNAQKTLARLSTYVAGAFMLVCLIVSIFSEEIVTVLAERGYSTSYKVIPVISLSYYLFGIYMLFLSGILVSKKVFMQPLVLGVGCILNILLNIMLIQRLGIMGAAVATAITYFCVASCTYLLAQRSYKIPYEMRRLTLITLSGVIIYTISLILSKIISIDSIIITVIGKFFIMLLYPITLFAFGFFGKEQLQKIKQVFLKAT